MTEISPPSPDGLTLSQKERKRRTRRRERRERLRTLWFLTPSLAGVLMFFVLPLMVVLYYSVLDSIVTKNFVFLENYIKLVNNVAFRQAVRNTLSFSALAVPLAVIIPLFLAIILMNDIPGKSKFRTVFITPLMVPVASVVLIWQVVFHNNGVLNEITALFGSQPIDWLKSDYGQVVILVLFLWKNIGYNMILFMSALAAIPKDILEVAMLEGAGPIRRFFTIKLRYLFSSIFFVSLLSLINSFKVFREVYLLTGAHPYDNLYMLQHYMNNVFESLEYPKLSSAAILMCVVMIVIIGIMLIVDDKLGGELEE
ncbi:MAG: sugar ABC transporter permease [Clostridia bacterium]|nr:sugar ABC transporter permease [Clostridia bacterium]